MSQIEHSLNMSHNQNNSFEKSPLSQTQVYSDLHQPISSQNDLDFKKNNHSYSTTDVSFGCQDDKGKKSNRPSHFLTEQLADELSFEDLNVDTDFSGFIDDINGDDSTITPENLVNMQESRINKTISKVKFLVEDNFCKKSEQSFSFNLDPHCPIEVSNSAPKEVLFIKLPDNEMSEEDYNYHFNIGKSKKKKSNKRSDPLPGDAMDVYTQQNALFFISYRKCPKSFQNFMDFRIY